jgi:N utilization substance protein A
VPVEDLTEIEGFDEEVAEELRNRAQSYLEERESELTDRRRELGVSDALAEMEQLTANMLVKLGENGIKTQDDLADLASDELVEILGDEAPSEEEAGQIIMAARAHWFEDAESPADAGTDETAGQQPS